MRGIGDLIVKRHHLVWALVALHALLIGLPLLAFASRDSTTGWEDLAWVAIGIDVVGAILRIGLAALGVAAPLVIADAVVGFSLLENGPIEQTLLAFGFFVAAMIAAVVQWLALREWIAWWRRRRSAA